MRELRRRWPPRSTRRRCRSTRCWSAPASTELAERRTDKLSGGQTQRVRFALALVADPDLLVLDEPTAAMDVEARAPFWASMRQLRRRGPDGPVRHPLPGRGRRRTPTGSCSWPAAGSSPTAPRPQIKAVVGGRTIRATLPGAATPRWPPCPASARSSGTATRSGYLHRLRRRPARAAGRHPAARDIEVGGADLEDAFVALTSPATGVTGMNATYLRTEVRRDAARPALLHLRRSACRSACSCSSPPCTGRATQDGVARQGLADGQHVGLRRDGRRGLHRRPDRRRAAGRLDPAAAADPDARPDVRGLQGGHRARRRVPALVLVYAVGALVEGVRLPAARWAEAAGWSLLALAPFVALGLVSATG